MLQLLFLVVGLVVLPVVINKTTERGRLDWIHPYLRPIWTGILVFYSWYLLTQPSGQEALMLLSRSWKPIYVYLVLAFAGAFLLCGYYWLAGWFFASKKATAKSEVAAIAELSKLGWTVKPGSDDTEFEIWTKPLPPMKESAVYFAQLQKPWRLHFQQVGSIQGLHELASVAGCTKIEISAGEFSDISELRGFESLSSLSISQLPLNGSAVVDASPLASLSNLRELNLSMVKIKNIDALTTLTKLEDLNLGGTLIRDLSPLANHSLLRTLEIRDTGVTDLAAISSIHDLNELGVDGKQVPSLARVAIPNLKRLRIMSQSPLDLAAVGTLTNLEYLWVTASTPQLGQVPEPLDISPLRNLVNLRELVVTGAFFALTPIKHIEALEQLRELRKLSLGDMDVSDITFVSKLTNLEEVGMGRMPITSIAPLRGLKSLTIVGLSNTDVVDISPLLDLPILERLNIVRTPARADVLSELERRGVKIVR